MNRHERNAAILAIIDECLAEYDAADRADAAKHDFTYLQSPHELVARGRTLSGQLL